MMKRNLMLITTGLKGLVIFFSFSDLSSHKDLAVAILECFSSPSEEIKSAASFALGWSDFFFLFAY